MKIVTAVIKPECLDACKTALAQAGVRGMTLTSVSGFGQEVGHSEVYRGARYNSDLISRVRIDVVSADEDADTLVNVLVEAAKTGNDGDGFIWVAPLDRVVRINTGDENEGAL